MNEENKMKADPRAADAADAAPVNVVTSLTLLILNPDNPDMCTFKEQLVDDQWYGITTAYPNMVECSPVEVEEVDLFTPQGQEVMRRTRELVLQKRLRIQQDSALNNFAVKLQALEDSQVDKVDYIDYLKEKYDLIISTGMELEGNKSKALEPNLHAMILAQITK